MLGPRAGALPAGVVDDRSSPTCLENRRIDRVPQSWFSSDWHAGHARVIEFGRPFPDVAAMNAEIVNGAQCMQPGDTLYFLGDVCLGVGPDKASYALAFRQLLPPVKIVLIRGNHDPRPKASEAFESVFDGVHELLEVKVSGHAIVLCHYPMETWCNEGHGAWHLHGHVHGRGERHPTKRRLDVGVDGHAFRPWSFDEVKAEMLRLPWAPNDHHGSRS
jgi:calcineurin-like phosphoesterase family protein